MDPRVRRPIGRSDAEVTQLGFGAGVNHTGMIPRFLERFDLDYFLVPMPYCPPQISCHLAASFQP